MACGIVYRDGWNIKKLLGIRRVDRPNGPFDRREADGRKVWRRCRLETVPMPQSETNAGYASRVYRGGYRAMVGRSEATQALLRQIEQIAGHRRRS